MTVRTRTETVTLFGGYTGGVQVVLFDADGNCILHDTIRYRYGVDGRAFSPGWRQDTESVELPQDVANRGESILIMHYWDPKVDILANIFLTVVWIMEIIKLINNLRDEGEPVNAGGDPF